MNNILRLIGRRLVQLPVMILGITFLVFFVMSLSPIDPALISLGEGASVEQREAWREANGYNDPLFVRYVSYLANLLQGDLGTYSARRLSVTEEIAATFPVTLQLTFLGLFIAVIGATVLGVLAALYRDGWPDHVIRVISVGSLSMPSFWLAILMIQLFTLQLGWLPASGPLPPFSEDPLGWLARMVLPAFALAVPVVGQLSRVIRTAMVEELNRDYVRTAMGAGIPRAVVISRNVFRNALITPVTVLGLRVGYLLGGAVVIEIIFNLPGMGTLILQGISSNEPNLVQGVTLVVAIAFVLINVIVDLLYVLINPRIRSV